ncbi:MAG: hypothetical protein FJ206_06210 [Gemmatimonadetes bacterium]|nr:hypothetical protein [Gemmatimonadota bacterium]
MAAAASAPSNRPTATATLPAGYLVTGGGCWVDWQRAAQPAGNLLTGSYPDETSLRSWICEAKDHLGPNPAVVHAYAIGIRAVSGPAPAVVITKVTSGVGPAPSIRATVAPGYEVTGGGARAEVYRMASLAAPRTTTRSLANRTVPGVAPPDSGVLLTASFPVVGLASAATGWEARAKDHGVSSPGSVTAFVIGIKLPPPPAPPPPPPPPPATCFCTATGPFAPAAPGPISGGLQGFFNHPVDGRFTVTAQLVSGLSELTVTDAQGRVALSVSGAVAWGVSPNSRYFAVVNSPVGTNAGSPLTAYRVARGSSGFRSIMSSEVWPDGRWGFSPDGSQLLIERLQNAPVSYSLTAHNLLAANPMTAVLHTQELSVFGPNVTISPCGDRLMYNRWTQLNPQQGQLGFYARKDYPMTSSVVADWDGSSATMSAAIEAGTTLNTFLVRLTGARLRSNGQTTFTSRQCEVP